MDYSEILPGLGRLGLRPPVAGFAVIKGRYSARSP
jgi:hypothetical protein